MFAARSSSSRGYLPSRGAPTYAQNFVVYVRCILVQSNSFKPRSIIKQTKFVHQVRRHFVSFYWPEFNTVTLYETAATIENNPPRAVRPRMCIAFYSLSFV